MKKIFDIFMHTFYTNSSMAEENKLRKSLGFYITFLYLCMAKGRKVYVSTITLLFVMMQLSGQTNARYGISILGNRSDTAQMETALLPSSYYELANSRNTNNAEIQIQAASFAINTSFAVGTTIGIPDVTATGGASYQIPIEVPKGIAGLEPSVAIGYNSQSGYGSMGYGWNLAASSAITRCGKTYYYDNAAEAPQLSNTDNLVLDGQRLILISGSNLTTGAKYRLEYDPFTDIAFKTVGGYPGFVVRTKDGNSREYGSTTNSSIETSGGGILLWLLSKVTDKNGNIITYEYEEIVGNGEFYLKKIQYSGNRSVLFSYETRNDKQKTYFAGAVLNNNKRLQSISTYINQTRIKQYQFNYDYDGFYSKLTGITENGQNNARYNSTNIDYGNSGIQADEYFASLSVKKAGNTPLFGDFNGDGKMDFLSFSNKTSYTTSDSAVMYLAYLYYGEVRFSKKCAIPMQFSGAVFKSFLLADLNGDGMTDVVNISQASNGTYRYNYYMFDGEKLTYNYKGFNTNDKEAITGDFNGDGKQEILVIGNKKVFNEEGREIASGGIDDWGSQYIKDYFPNNRYLCDFNGNGKTDILVMNGSSGWVYELNGSSFVRLSAFNTTNIKNTYFPYFGDFNGDGKTDVLIKNVQGGNNNIDVSILFSTGKGFVKQTMSNADIKAKVFVGDFNRDGKSDIFHMEVVNNTIRMKVGTFNGTDFTTAYYSTILTPSAFNVDYQYENFLFQVADFDGDGRSEFCNARYADTYIIHSFTDSQNLLAKTITNGLGATTSFEYAPITNGSACTNTGNSAFFPVAGHLYPLYVATSMRQSAGNYYDVTYYRYKNPRMHIQGKGFMGFGEIESESYYKDRKTVTKYDYNTYYYPYITEQTVTTRSGTNLSLSRYENSYTSHGGKRITPYIRKQTDTDHLTGTVMTVERKETDSYGNPQKMETKYGNDVTETVTYSYFNSGTDNLWIYGLPLSVEKKTARGSENWIGKQTFIYNSRYLPEKVTSYTNDGTKKVSEETFLYDTFGNVTTHSSKAFTSTNTLTTRYEYSNGIFLTKVTNPLLQATTSVYNASGRLESVKDHRNNTTTYQYDGMGRLIRKNYPDGTFSSVALAWGGSPANSVYCVTEQTTGKPVVKTYHDAFNRELRNSISRYDGSEMHRNREYNSAGRLYRESMPFKGASASLWNTYGYDSYGRINSENKASGKTTTYVYSGRNVTVTENGMASTRYYDAQGNLTSVADLAGTITYNLRPDGQPTSVVAPGNVTTLFHYDMYGRRDTITDPSAGKRSIEYDAAGNIYREKDANGRTKTMYYDAYNRLLTRVLPEFTTNCSYNQDGLIALEVSTNGTSTSYSYDNLMRLSTVQDNAPDSKWFKKAFSYAGSNVASVQYTSQSGTLGTETYTYESGHLSEIKFGSTSVWKLNEENSFGQPKSIATGPLTRTYGYNSYGVPNGRTAARSTGSTVQNHTYDFDMVKGNLNYRKDNTRNIQESFTYDGLNRLKTFAGKNMEYDIKGNIKEKSDVGANFLYNTPGKPYAISGVDVGNNTAIPLRDQQVTYTSFERPASISENNYTATFTYNGGGDRVKMQLLNGSSNYLTRYYLGGIYEIDEGTSGSKERLYMGGDAYSAPAVYIRQNGAWSLHYILRDYLGSITHVTNSSGSVVQELSYDAWGRLRNPANQTAYALGQEPTLFLGRGYTGHEHLPQFGLINMNARLYDPAIGRFLLPDPFVQMPDFSQNFNRYSYCLNNPFKYVDPSGEIVWFVPVIIGAAIGAYSGGVMANDGQYNPTKWDYNSGKTWGYMAGGAVVGGVSGYAGWAIAGSGIPMANTAAIAGSSLINSVGTWAYTGGQTPISISFGVASYDFTNGTFGYIGKKGNKWYENLGYGLGALANVSDILTGLQPKGVDLVTEHSDGTGHSGIVKEGTSTATGYGNGNPANADPNGIISVGPNRHTDPGGSWHWMKGTNKWDTHTGTGEVFWRQNLKVNMSTIEKYANWLNAREAAGKLVYSVELSSCVTHTSTALNLSGIFNIGIHPYLLNAQMYLWSNGIRPWTFSYFFNR
ncbi:hypothetical protein FACS1894123_08890 [Bacteroidia bacterium]|nr:hypothetical protein FACS1894123_08890 [Bacteroidia bacterium]